MRIIGKRLLAAGAAIALLASVGACGGRSGSNDSGKSGGSGASEGFTDSQVSIGSTCASTGNLASFQTTCAAEQAYFKYINEEKGGVKMGDGKTRKIKFTWYDDGYSPPKTLEQTKRLVEKDHVAATFGFLGTGTSLAVRDYLNQRKVPELFVDSGAPTFGFDYGKYPWTISGQVSYSLEGTIYGDFVKSKNPNARVAVIYQNDDFGKSLLGAFKNAIKGSNVKIASSQTYESTATSVSSQITTLAASKADYLLVFTIPKFAVQTLQTANRLGWKPTIILNSVVASIKSVIEPAGRKTAVGAYTGVYVMDPTNPAFKDSDDMKFYRTIAKKYGSSNLAVDDSQSVIGFVNAQMLVAALEGAKEPTRAALMESARHLNGVTCKGLLPGIKATTDGGSDPFPLESMQIMNFDGNIWNPTGGLITKYEGKTPKPAA